MYMCIYTDIWINKSMVCRAPSEGGRRSSLGSLACSLYLGRGTARRFWSSATSTCVLLWTSLRKSMASSQANASAVPLACLLRSVLSGSNFLQASGSFCHDPVPHRCSRRCLMQRVIRRPSRSSHSMRRTKNWEVARGTGLLMRLMAVSRHDIFTKR